MIPDRDECLKLMAQHGMLSHMMEHSLEVTRVALFLGTELKKRGQEIDLGLVEAASMLHDLTKTECLRTKADHAESAAQRLSDLGYGRVAKVVAQHVWLLGEGEPSRISEEEIVNYSDKRVRHDQVVSLKDRFKDLKDRYGNNESAGNYWELLEKRTFGIENKILMILQIDAKDLQNL